MLSKLNYLDALPPLVAASRFGLDVIYSSLTFKSANCSGGARYGATFLSLFLRLPALVR